MGVHSKFRPAQFSLILFLYSLFTGSVLPQTVIKEKIIIKPPAAFTPALFTKEDCTIKFSVNWSASNYQGFVGMYDSEGWISTGDWTDGGSVGCSATVSDISSISYQFRLNLPENVVSQFTYLIEISGVTVQRGTGTLVGRWINFAYADIGFQPTLYTGFDFELIDNRYGWSTGVLNINSEANVNLIPFLNCDTIPFLPNSALINLTIEPEIEGVSFFNWETRDTIGWSHTVGIDETSNYYVALLPDYLSKEERIIKVTASYNGYNKSDTLRIPPRYYSILTEPTRVYMNWLNKHVDVFGFLGDWEEPLPDTIRYNLEILNDNSLIEVVLSNSGERGKLFTNIPHEYGYLGFEVVTTIEKPLNDDTFKIRISATDPGINPVEVEVIYPAQRMLVEFNPKTIMPGDTADVILKKITEDGSLINFPQDQLFDFGLIGGELYGTIFVPEWGDTTDEGWYVEQGFKFIGAGEIENLPVESVLMVKTSEGFSGSVQKENKETSNSRNLSAYRQLKQKKNARQQINAFDRDIRNDLISKARMETENNLWGIGKISIGNGNHCSDAPKCNTPPKDIQVLLNADYKNGSFGIDSCSSSKNPYGFFLPLTGDNHSNITFEDFDLEICYNEIADKWQANIITNQLRIRAIKDLCIDNLINDGIRIIYNLNQISQEINNKEEAWKAFVEFYNHMSYPVSAKIMILEFISNHEQIHLDQYTYYSIPISLQPERGYFLNEKKYKNFQELFSDFGPSCAEISNIDSVTNGARLYFEIILELLRKELKDSYKWGRTWENESNINSFITQKKIIIKYQDELIKLFPAIKGNVQFSDYYVKGI